MQVMQAGKRSLGNRFDGVDFGVYTFQAYPKAVGGTMLEPIIVNNEKEEEEYYASQKPAVGPKPTTLTEITAAGEEGPSSAEGGVTEPVVTKKQRLISEAQKLGVEVDEDWSYSKLEREIKKAQG